MDESSCLFFEKKMEGKKIIETIGIAMAVVILSVIGALVIGSIVSNSVFDSGSVSGTNTNESLGLVTNITNTTFAIKATQSTATCTLTALYNASSGEALTALNYTFYSSACNLILNSTSSYVNESLNATYGYVYSTGLTALNLNVTNIGIQFGLFITGLIAFLAIIGIIVGVIWLVFYVKSLFDKKTGIQAITA